MIKIRQKGDFSKLTKHLNKLKDKSKFKKLDMYGQLGVEALSSATPTKTGKTASSWGYEIENQNGLVSIKWTNSNVKNGVNIAVILQYGHGTGTGGWVQGRDYINPAIRPIFDKIANEVWKEVTSI